MLAALLALLWAAPAQAPIEGYLGRTLVDVRVELAGRPLDEPSVIEVIETRVGEPLGMRQVRATVDHLVGLGRFADIRVYAAPAEGGVVLRWVLMPIRTIGRVEATGQPVWPVSELRSVLSDRFGEGPPMSRVPEMVAALRSFYADRGYRAASIEPRLLDGETPGRAELRLAIAPGPRTVIAAVSVSGTPPEPRAEFLRKVGLAAGQALDRPAIGERVAAYEEDLREQGYYEARARESVSMAADGSATVTVAVEPGPLVRVAFAGDPLPAGNREVLVPIRAERSVDQDLLEDASRNIETALRRQGYRSAQAPYTREESGGELLLTFTVTRGPLHRVGAVTLAGVSGLPPADLEPLLQVKAGEPFVEARVGAVGAAIAEMYRVRGFSQVAVAPGVQVLPAETRGGVSYRPVDVRYDIVEGPRTLVRTVEVIGASALADDRLRSLMALSAGRPFYRPQLDADRDVLERAFRNEGYQDASVTPQLAFSPDNGEVGITWLVREGPQVQVDRILITGNARTSPDLIRRELVLKPGSPLSEDAMAESQQRLAALGLFRRVRITELPRTGDSTRDVLVEVEEADATTITYGGGIEVGRRYRQSETDATPGEHVDVAPRGFFDISRRNLWGKNRSVTLFARATLKQRDPAADNPDPTDTGGYGLNDYRGFFSFREPRAFGTAGEAQFTAFVEQGIRTSFNFNRKGVAGDYGRRFGTVSVTGRYSFDSTKLFDEKILPADQLLIDRLFPQVKLSKFFGAVLRDSRDDVLDPQKGAVLGIDGTVAARVLGSEVGFVKSFMQAFLYRRLPGRGVVVAMGARLGVAVGVAEAGPEVLEIARGGLTRSVRAATALDTTIKDLPASERFFAGGDTTVRGFSLDQLGTEETLDPQGFPQGGNGLAVFNIEARAPHWKNIQMVGFIDAGNVFKFAGDIRLGDLRVATGFGVRYRSPIGPLRVDWGFKVHPRLLPTGGREKAHVLHISLGQAF